MVYTQFKTFSCSLEFDLTLTSVGCVAFENPSCHVSCDTDGIRQHQIVELVLTFVFYLFCSMDQVAISL